MMNPTIGADTDLTGMRFGKLTVLGLDESSRALHAGKRWLCRCDCGNEISVTGYFLRGFRKRTCGCGAQKKTDNPGMDKPKRIVILREEHVPVHDCKFNAGVRCTRKHCLGCGWNPEVAAERSRRILGEQDG